MGCGGVHFAGYRVERFAAATCLHADDDDDGDNAKDESEKKKKNKIHFVLARAENLTPSSPT